MRLESAASWTRSISCGCRQQLVKARHARVQPHCLPWNVFAVGDKGSEFTQLLGTSSEDFAPGGRARSATDAGALRRKGRLKEQDHLIDFIRQMHSTHTCEEVMIKMERWVQEHRKDPKRSQLKRLVPAIGTMFTDLPLMRAFREYDEFFALSRRRFVPPNFAEIRHILNIAQVHASAEYLKLITFDADGTIYADGAHMEQDSHMIDIMIELMRLNICVAIVTAAGYPGEPHLFEKRMEGLLDSFKARHLPKHVTDNFLMLGGECNYLLRYNSASGRLEFVPDDEWKTPDMLSWTLADIQYTLDHAQHTLTEAAAGLKLPVQVIRKERAVGVVPLDTTIYEVLEDLAITVDSQLVDMPVPFCAFNGGADVFVDIGNKSLGLEALMNYTGAMPHSSLHVGDRFTASGNDNATRDCCCILWVACPEETVFFTDTLLDDINQMRGARYIE